MDKKLKNKWLRALTGKLTKNYKQTRSALKRDGGFCCLGVLADIQGCSWSGSNPVFKNDVQESASYLLAKHAGGLKRKQQEKLAHMNDQGKSFEEIAAYIKKHYK